jgi:hypothetical protein
MRPEAELIRELRGELVRLRAALAEAMDWRWGDDPPPADVVERLEVALGLPEESRPILRQGSGVLRERPEGSCVTAPPLPKSA